MLLPALTIFEEEAAELGLHVNWQKTKVQSLSDFFTRPDNLIVCGEEVECVESFNYLGILTHESGNSGPEIMRRLAIAGGAFSSFRNNVWDTRLALPTKVRLFNTYVLPVLLYGSETWTISATDQLRLDAFGTKCLRSICGIKWSDFVTNEEVYKRTGQLPSVLSSAEEDWDYLATWPDYLRIQMCPSCC